MVKVLALSFQISCVRSDAVVTSISVETNSFHDIVHYPSTTSPPPIRRNSHHRGYSTAPTSPPPPRLVTSKSSHSSRRVLQKLLKESRGSIWNSPFREPSFVGRKPAPYYEEVSVSSNMRDSSVQPNITSNQSSLGQNGSSLKSDIASSIPDLTDFHDVLASFENTSNATSRTKQTSLNQSGPIREDSEAAMEKIPIILSSIHNDGTSLSDSSTPETRSPLLESISDTSNRTAHQPSNKTDRLSFINRDNVQSFKGQNPDESSATATDELDSVDDHKVESVNDLPSRRGVLKVRITEFLNPSNKDADGDCCMKNISSSSCGGYCRLFFRVCATHSSRNVVLSQRATPPPKHPGTFRPTTVPPEDATDSRNLFSMPSLEAVRHKMMSSRRAEGVAAVVPTPKKKEEKRNFDPNVPCTLGLIVTEVVANSSLRANVEGALDITFPFTSDWPVSFRIIVEAWHDVTGFLFNSSQPPLSADRAGTLVARHASRLSVVAGQAWQTQRRVMTHAASIIYGVRVACMPPYTGARCTLPLEAEAPCIVIRTSQVVGVGRVEGTDQVLETGQVEGTGKEEGTGQVEGTGKAEGTSKGNWSSGGNWN
ncbi:Notch ligand N-terminal domain [Trinorchestia longiramus]|nr:Notch ligand N-terminal domain [Trinorchestia longiramus]